MKRIAITGLFLSAALLASPVFAAEDLCAANLQKIDDQRATKGASAEGMDTVIDKNVEDAKAAQAAGNDKDCIALTSKILERLEKGDKGQ